MKKMIALLLVLTVLFVCPAVAEGYGDMLNKAAAYTENGEYDKALACYQLARRVDPEEEAAYLGEANLRLMTEDKDGAADVIDEALERIPLSAPVWLLKCRLDVLRGDAAAFEADAVFAEVCGVDFTPIAASIAMMYAARGDYERAAPYFGRADIGKMNENERMMYRRMLIAEGRFAEAEALGLKAASWHDTALDAAFEADALALVLAEAPRITADDFELPEEIWAAIETEKPSDPHAELTKYLETAVITQLSLSPSGNSGVLTAQDGTWFAQYNGVYRLIYPTSARGVVDVYEKLERYARMQLQKLLGEEDVVYSPDGRYAAIYNVRIALQNISHFLDPILVDLSTGEMFLTATYPRKTHEENAGAVTTACFSSDNRYFYYNMYGAMQDRAALYRYDLETGTTERCYSGNSFTYYPTLSETAGGAFLMIRDASMPKEKTGVVMIRYADGRWSEKEYTNNFSKMYWQSNRLLYSVNSGYALMPGRNALSDVSYVAFKCFRPDEDFAGFDRVLTVPINGGAIEEVTTDDFVAAMDTAGRNAAKNMQVDIYISHTAILPYQTILCAHISPDGFYALLLTLDDITADVPNARHLYLARLADGQVREVRGIDPKSIPIGPLGYGYQPTIEWNTDRLIIITDDGIGTYRFDFTAP